MSRVIVSVCLVLVLAHDVELVPSKPQFLCSDGLEIAVENVCDGSVHCSDSSDETSKLCHRITCPTTKFRCAYGACIGRTERCDGVIDCLDGSDEFYCGDENACNDDMFLCSTSLECLPSSVICDGVPDCGDGSDETTNVCKDHICPENTFQCDYGGCVPAELVCDKVKDCIDGSDENNHTCPDGNCQGGDCPKLCSKKHFGCKSNNQCIPLNRLCDGTSQCRDGSDESDEACKEHNCSGEMFRCKYGACIPMKSRCNGVRNCRDWSDEDEQICGLTHPLPEGACRLPPAKPGVTYSIVSGCERCRPGNVAPELTSLEFACHENSTLEGERRVFCQNNRWLPHLPTCPKKENDTIKCPPVKSPGTSKRCEIMWGPNPGWTNCNEPMPVGTKVTLECLEFYERKLGSSRMTCFHDGTWSQTPLSCQPICGVRTSNSIALIVNGWDAPYEEPIPWHATLFSHEYGNWNFFCGATLITENIVLTAGHCVWKTTPETIRVVLGSNSSNYLQQGTDTQVRSVSRIEVQTSYHDQEGNYNSDMALLILSKAVEINSDVLPACLDWPNKHNIDGRVGEIGMVVGMGITENDTFSPTLRLTTAEFVSEEECREQVKRDFRKYLTYSSFCAGWANGTSVCNGDSGGGFLLQNPDSELWEIHGIVSLSPRKISTSVCDPNYYTVFTKVAVYMDWIKRVMESAPVRESDQVDHSSIPNKDIVIL